MLYRVLGRLATAIVFKFQGFSMSRSVRANVVEESMYLVQPSSQYQVSNVCCEQCFSLSLSCCWPHCFLLITTWLYTGLFMLRWVYIIHTCLYVAIDVLTEQILNHCAALNLGEGEDKSGEGGMNPRGSPVCMTQTLTFTIGTLFAN